jgi:uncharacterized membrane protein YkvA (DUF1232 family)
MRDEEMIIIDEKDIEGVEITIDEHDIQEAANAYVEWHKDIIVINPDDVDMTPISNQRFYDKLRQDIQTWAASKGVNNKYLEYILLAPDFFMLLVRLIADERVPLKLRTILISACAYFISPIDAMPEAILGPLGYLDDVVLAALAIFVTLNHIDETVVREHWSGTGDIVALVQKIVSAGEALLHNAKLWDAFKKKTAYE